MNIHTKAVREEMDKLEEAGAIREVYYPECLANTVVVKKKNGKWIVRSLIRNLLNAMTYAILFG